MNQIPHWLQTNGPPSVTKPTRLIFATDPVTNDVWAWTGTIWVKLTGATGDGVPRVTTAQRVARPEVQHDLVLDIDLDRLMVFHVNAWQEA
jgi:hypothetical protein